VCEYTSKIKVKLHRYRHAGVKGERRCSSYSLLNSVLDGDEWSASRPGRALPPGKDPGIHWIGDLVGLRAGLDTESRGEIIFLCRGSKPGLYRLSPQAPSWRVARLFYLFLPAGLTALLTAHQISSFSCFTIELQ
jgi:hypothetical protein